MPVDNMKCWVICEGDYREERPTRVHLTLEGAQAWLRANNYLQEEVFREEWEGRSWKDPAEPYKEVIIVPAVFDDNLDPGCLDA